MGQNKDTFEAWQAVRASRTSSDPVKLIDTHNHQNNIVLSVHGHCLELTIDDAQHLSDLLKVALIDHEAFESSWKASRFNKGGE